MRKKFQSYFEENLCEFEFFEPEFAMKNYFSEEDDKPFDIAEFEKLVGELSHSIVIFPEAAGSFAETGYFSATPDLACKTILALDSSEQVHDSFISLGPAKKISEASRFHPNIQIDYSDPDFGIVAERIRRLPVSTTKKAFKVVPFSEMTAFALFALTREFVSLMTIATLDDLMFMHRSIFSNKLSTSKIKQVASILVGSGHLLEVGNFGHFTVKNGINPLLTIRDGAKNDKDEILLTLASIYPDADPEFLTLVTDARDAS